VDVNENVSQFGVSLYCETKHGQVNLRSLTDELLNLWSFTNINRENALRRVRWTDAL